MGYKREMKSEGWTFFRAGGFDQVKLESGRDLLRIGELDQKLWVALACPTSGLELDPRTLALIDADSDGRMRASELIAAVKFAGANLKNPDDLLKGAASLPLSSFNDALPEGKTLLSAARQILVNIGKPEATSLAVEDVSDPTRIFADSAFNGDGVVTEISAADEATKAVIREIMAYVGSDLDRSGKPGVTQEKIDQFFAEAEAYVAWNAEAEAEATKVFPLGSDATTAAVAAVQAIRAKVDDYFARCRLAAFDSRAAAALNRKEEEYLEVAAQDLSITAAEVAGFPLAQVAADRPLPLAGRSTRRTPRRSRRSRQAAVAPLLGQRAQLTEADWTAMGARLAAHEAWMAAKPAQTVEKLGMARIREIWLRAPRRAGRLVARDKRARAGGRQHRERRAAGPLPPRPRAAVQQLRQLQGLLRGRRRPAIFQAGTLYLDQRLASCACRSRTPAKHAALAGLAGAYLAYCDCARKGTGEKMTIVAAFTAGDTDNLMVGRNGIFYDRQGRDWDATITKIVDNPISIRQAFWSPYKKFVRCSRSRSPSAPPPVRRTPTRSWRRAPRRPPTSARPSRPRRPRRSTSARSPRSASRSAPSAPSSRR